MRKNKFQDSMQSSPVQWLVVQWLVTPVFDCRYILQSSSCTVWVSLITGLLTAGMDWIICFLHSEMCNFKKSLPSMFILTAEDFPCYMGKSREASDRRHGCLASLTIPILTWTVAMQAASWVCRCSSHLSLSFKTTISDPLNIKFSISVLFHEWCIT